MSVTNSQTPKPTLILIHGGDAFATNQEYLSNLEEQPPRLIDNLASWKKQLPDQLTDYFECVSPLMPTKSNAHYDEWKLIMDKVLALPQVSEDLFLVGHSLGSIFLQKYLAENSLDDKLIHQIHFVSACPSEGDFEQSPNWQNISEQCSNVQIWHSQDDKVISYNEALNYYDNLPGSRLNQFLDRGHFNQSNFPELSFELLKPFLL